MRMEEIQQKEKEKFDNWLTCLLPNLIASPRGWRIPINETLFGPYRQPIIPKILRSKSVKNATEIKPGRIIKMNFRIVILIIIPNIIFEILNFTHLICQIRIIARKKKL